MGLEDKTKKIIYGKKRKEVIVIAVPLTNEEARNMFLYRPYSRYSESMFGGGNTFLDDFALLMNGKSKGCGMCQAPTRTEYLIDNTCPDCDGRLEYNGKDPRTPVN